jgi:hypothetical protein
MYHQKIAQRLELANLRSEYDRLRFVEEHQPWVFKQLPNNVLAGYLSVKPERVKELKSEL